ncbi:MAG: hypothetical protein PHF97_01935 [Bacteroidales bacterium]|nr:hypothetical protein [Bacteroidales bacterium]MDD4602552.1 hypothetical protein [Bacteroidales bacterium]
MLIKLHSPRFLIFSIALFSCLATFGQIRIASPYSRFGLGDLTDNNNAWNLSVGQLGISLRSPYHVNFTNPASYTAFDSLSFVFEGGFNGEFVTLSSNFQTVKRSYASLGYILFGMPVTKWWKTSLGLVPYSDVGYSVANYEEYPGAGTVLRLYSGSGGISRFYWGNAVQIGKNLSLGVNASYLFGSMIRESAIYFPDSLYMMNFKEDYSITMNDIYFSFGAQYTAKLKNDLYLNIGAVFAPTSYMKAKTDILAQTFLVSTSTGEIPKDTLVNAEAVKGDIVIPMMLGGGLSLQKQDKWMVGVDYRWQNWEKFRAFDLSDSLVNSWQVSAGGEIIPKNDNFTNYLARVHYRLGFTYSKTYLRLRETNLNEYGISIGFGLPLRGVKTMLNIGGEFGARGTIQKDLIRESYFKIVVGFTIYDRWFIKRKYN